MPKSPTSYLSKFLVFSLLFSSLTKLSFASFNDVDEDYKNFDAINYLQENQIIEGYEDGSFRPNNDVKRAEFLKIIIEGSNISTDVSTNTPFVDVNHNSWYAPYLKKAYAEGWIEGYEDGTYRPSDPINKVEALKILAEVQDWTLSDSVTSDPFTDVQKSKWYASYVSYAKTNNFLEEEGNFFRPGEDITRGGISEIIYRTLISSTSSQEPQAEEDDNNENVVETDQEENQDESETIAPETFQPVTASTISKSFFTDITLTNDIPNTFYAGEIYIISGEVNSNYDSATVILDASTHSEYVSFSSETENNNFEIPVFFETPGNYNLGIIPGTEGETSAKKISVLSSLPEAGEQGAPKSPSDLSINYTNDQTSVSFNTENSTIKKLTFKQNNKSKTYINRQNIDTIPINYKDFKNFNEGDVDYYLESATTSGLTNLKITSTYSKSNTQTFKAMEHSFDFVSEDINATIPEKRSNTNSFSFSGTVDVDTQMTAFVIKPDGFVEEFELTTNSPTSDYFGSEVINAGGSFTFTYDPEESGRHIIEINNYGGEAIVNRPIYIGDGVPLIPDYFDLNTRELFTGNFNLTNERQTLLNLINESRNAHDLSSITLNNDLNNLAQAHSEDMKANNYFAHVNTQNQTPQDRRIAAGISTSVSENIAQDTSTPFAHWGLMRSAAHRQNILNPDWTQVGIGIALDDGHLIVTEEFSTNPINENDLANYKTQLLSNINSKRSDDGAAELEYAINVENASKDLNDALMGGEELDQELFNQILTENNIVGSSQTLGRTYNIWNEILESLLKEETIISSTWKRIGIDIQLDDTGEINIILILNDNI